MFGLNHILLSMEKGVFRVVSHHDLTCDQAKSRKLPTIMERSLCLLAPCSIHANEQQYMYLFNSILYTGQASLCCESIEWTQITIHT